MRLTLAEIEATLRAHDRVRDLLAKASLPEQRALYYTVRDMMVQYGCTQVELSKVVTLGPPKDLEARVLKDPLGP